MGLCEALEPTAEPPRDQGFQKGENLVSAGSLGYSLYQGDSLRGKSEIEEQGMVSRKAFRSRGNTVPCSVRAGGVGRLFWLRAGGGGRPPRAPPPRPPPPRPHTHNNPKHPTF